MLPKVLSAKDLKPDQQDGVEMILSFANDRTATELLVEGAAGTGKTSMIRAAVNELPEEQKNGVVVCAPTNKAVKVAKELSGDTLETTTIYKLLGLSPQPNGEVKELRQSQDVHERLMATSVVMLDEGSMVPSSIRPYVQEAIHDYGIKFVYIGDRYQLNPVHEDISWVFDTQRRIQLTEVKRHDNQILNLATHIRQVLDAGGNGLSIQDAFDAENGGVEVFRRGKPFDERILDTWNELNGEAERDFSGHRVLAWRNARVEGFNELVREQLYGRREARNSALMVGERVVVCNPVKSLQDETEMLMSTDEEGYIERLSVSVHPKYPEIECFKLVILRESTNTVVGVYTPTPAGWKVANRMLSQFQKKAKTEDRVYWGAFWALKDLLNDVRPCHALTTHRSQGSTFHETFVDADDILANPNRTEALKSFYVGVTRAAHKVNVKWGGR